MVAESSWPSPSNGRVVDDAQWEKLAINLGIPAGVYGDFTNPQLVYGDSTGMQIKVAADRYAHVRGHEWWSGSSIFTKAISANSSGSTRTDLVVLRLSRTSWDVTVTVVNGTPGAGAPSPTQNTGTTGSWDLPLATVTVANNASTITAANVTYMAPHLPFSGGPLRIPSEPASAYLPSPFVGAESISVDGTRMRYDGTSWLQLYGWRDWTPVVYHNMSTTRTTYGSYSINRARYMKLGHMVWATADISITGATTGGMSASIPFTAVSMANSVVGAGAIVNSGGAPSQDGYVIIGNGLDNVQPVTVTTGFINTTAGANRYRFTIVYESAS